LLKPEPLDGSNVMPFTAAQTATTRPKRTTTTALLVALSAAISFGGVGALMGYGVMTTTTTKIDDDAHPPQVIIAV
jgi:hypothetical protein